jgi:aminotransferase in exopolysaccharide biosynthesis
MYKPLINFIRDQYQTKDFIPLHAPVFTGKEREYVVDTIDSTFVSSVGSYVDRFEDAMSIYTGSPRAIATMNGTASLHMALLLAGVKQGDLVITQPLTFVATCNAISYCLASPVFVDVERNTLSMSPFALEAWLEDNSYLDSLGVCRTKVDKRVVRACVPMHTFGHPANLDGLVKVCNKWNIVLVEDAAESLGSFYKGRHTGTFGVIAALSFNGNKIITTGGGGMILTSEELGARAKYLTTTAKKPHPFEYVHDEVGYNYRLPNLNAALGCAQLERLESFIKSKRILAERYKEVLKDTSLEFVCEPADCRSNYWLNSIICESRVHRDEFLKVTNKSRVMTRPIWALMNHLSMYAQSLKGDLTNAEWLEARIVNLPSSVLPDITL